MQSECPEARERKQKLQGSSAAVPYSHGRAGFRRATSASDPVREASHCRHSPPPGTWGPAPLPAALQRRYCSHNLHPTPPASSAAWHRTWGRWASRTPSHPQGFWGGRRLFMFPRTKAGSSKQAPARRAPSPRRGLVTGAAGWHPSQLGGAAQGGCFPARQRSGHATALLPPAAKRTAPRVQGGAGGKRHMRSPDGETLPLSAPRSGRLTLTRRALGTIIQAALPINLIFFFFLKAQVVTSA